MATDQLKHRIRLITVTVAVVFLALLLPGGARVTAAPCPPSGPVPSDQPGCPRAPARFTWPLDTPPAVGRPFDPPPAPYLAGHRGVDLVATPGATVLAPADGVVVFAGRLVDRGVVALRHDGTVRTSYEPVTALVKAGARVRPGDKIGTLVAGHRGCPAAACLHWGLRHEGVYLDPLLALTPLRVRLLPL